MKIRISTGSKNFTICVPTGMIFSKPALWLYMKIGRRSMSYAKQYMPEDADVSVNNLFDNVPEEAAYAICDELRRIKKKYGTWELVNVESADGSLVNITI